MASALYQVIAAFEGHAEAHGWLPASVLPRKGLATLRADRRAAPAGLER